MQIKDEAQYQVALSDRAELLGEKLYPGREYIIRGDMLKTIQDKVASAVEIR